ncbi:MAG: porin family protein [Steroidobacteraceae bacterium]|nr:porin family protein [Steroidobacteraceae bacterium]
MKVSWKVIGLAGAGALLASAVPAYAQVQASTHTVDAYAGALFGDDVTDTQLSGRTPELDDDVTFGLRYGYNFTEQWGLDASLGFSPSKVTGLPGGDVDIDLTTLDLDAVYHFDTGTRLVPYVLAGVGYAFADLDRPLQGTVNGQPVSIRDDDGFTFNAGVGAKLFATDHLLFRLEGRYRYLDKVVDTFDHSLNTFETTLGVGYQF